MHTKSQYRFLSCLLAASVLTGAALPSKAEKWPGVGSAPAGALAARVIGLMCPGSLSHDDIHDLDIYLAKKRLKGETNPANGLNAERRFYPKLEADYIADYRQAESCTADATEMAKDMVQRVRAELKSSPM